MKTIFKLLFTATFIINSLQIYSQVSIPSNGGGTATDYVGWDATNPFPLTIAHYGNQPINILTNGTQRGQWTTGSSLGGSGVGSPLAGDGLYVYSISGPGTGIGIWTGVSNTTHIKFDGSGLIQGQNNNFEFWAERQGFWMNTTTSFGKYLFNRSGIEDGRLVSEFFFINS